MSFAHLHAKMFSFIYYCDVIRRRMTRRDTCERLYRVESERGQATPNGVSELGHDKGLSSVRGKTIIWTNSDSYHYLDANEQTNAEIASQFSESGSVTSVLFVKFWNDVAPAK